VGVGEGIVGGGEKPGVPECEAVCCVSYCGDYANSEGRGYDFRLSRGRGAPHEVVAKVEGFELRCMSSEGS